MLREEALRVLGEWAKPSGRDRIVGLWRPLQPRSAELAVKGLMPVLDGIEVLALDALRPSPPHPTHFTIGEAIEVAQEIGAPTTYLIHLTHEVDHDEVEATLPEGVHLAYDGLTLRFE